MSIISKGSPSSAFRYFLFILLLCIVLFVFLMSRLAEGIEREIEYEGMMVPTVRAVQWTPGDAAPWTPTSKDVRAAAL